MYDISGAPVRHPLSTPVSAMVIPVVRQLECSLTVILDIYEGGCMFSSLLGRRTRTVEREAVLCSAAIQNTTHTLTHTYTHTHIHIHRHTHTHTHI